jgi:hypothetical protein
MSEKNHSIAADQGNLRRCERPESGLTWLSDVHLWQNIE